MTGTKQRPGAGKPERGMANAILEIVSTIPHTAELRAASPSERARAIQASAALRAAAVSGSLALPPGPWGVATVLPDLLVVWRIQAQMVADIAGVFGKTAQLSREQMLYCLFKHAAAQVVRDLAARVGQRVVFKHATLKTIQTIAQKLGIKVTQRIIAKSAARWIPVLGALGVAGYAYYDTAQVGLTALQLFQDDLDDDRQ